MKIKYVATAALSLAMMIGYGAFLAQRDEALFSSYYRDRACEQLKTWHPDCPKKQ